MAKKILQFNATPQKTNSSLKFYNVKHHNLHRNPTKQNYIFLINLFCLAKNVQQWKGTEHEKTKNKQAKCFCTH
jgi:hypothetical protein